MAPSSAARAASRHPKYICLSVASAKFHDGARGEQITLIVPPGNDKTHHMMMLVNTKQLVIDVLCDGMIKYIGVFAADMAKPMCPMFKQ